MNHRRIAVTLAGVAAFINLYAPQSLLPLLRDWIGQDAARAGLIVSAGTFGVALAAPFAGLLADRYGRRQVIVVAAFLAVIPGLFAGLAPTPEILMAVRFIQGLCLPGIFAVTVAYIAEEWPASEARAVTAVYVAGTIGGGFCGRLLSGVVAEFAGWRWGFAALALMQLAIALLIRAWLPAGRDVPRHRDTPRTPLLPLLLRPGLRGAYATGFLMLFALVGGFTYMTLHLSQVPYSLGPAALSMIFAVYLAGVVITPYSGRLLNAFGHPKVLVMAWTLGLAGLLLTLFEPLPVIGLGTAIIFDIGNDAAQRAERSKVINAYLAGGGRLIDTAPSYGSAESVVGDLLADLKVRDKVFLATKVRSNNNTEFVAQMKESQQRLRSPKFDLIQMHNVGFLDRAMFASQLAIVREWKQQGTFRYIGVTHSLDQERANDRLIEMMQQEKLDFIQVNYSMAERSVEDRLLAAAADTGTAVLCNLPFARGVLFRAVRGQTLPSWAAEAGAFTWGQFFLKYLLAHPAVNAVMPGTDMPAMPGMARRWDARVDFANPKAPQKPLSAWEELCQAILLSPEFAVME